MTVIKRIQNLFAEGVAVPVGTLSLGTSPFLSEYGAGTQLCSVGIKNIFRLPDQACDDDSPQPLSFCNPMFFRTEQSWVPAQSSNGATDVPSYNGAIKRDADVPSYTSKTQNSSNL